MAVQISGVLKDGAGKPVQACSIELRSRKTSPTVIVHIVAECITDSNGRYLIEAEPGFYDVFLLREGWAPVKAGEIYVTQTDKPDTLNAFLDAPKDGDLRPEVMKRFEIMVNTVITLSEQVTRDKEATGADAAAAAESASAARESERKSQNYEVQSQKNAESAAGSAQEAGQYAVEAAQARDNTQTLADAVQKNAEVVAEQRQQVNILAAEMAENAGQVQQDKQDTERLLEQAQQAASESSASAGESGTHAGEAAQSARQVSSDLQKTVTARNEAEGFATEAASRAEESAQIKVQTESVALNVQHVADSVVAVSQSVELQAGQVQQLVSRAEDSATTAGEHEQGALKALEEAREIAKTPGPQGEPGPQGRPAHRDPVVKRETRGTGGYRASGRKR
ncbi:prophage tail fiber N-terminal domain-containing protein [Escherichia coli]|nr:prophage tail fiber N-terminal domain-containing protein [Escherichia coli]